MPILYRDVDDRTPSRPRLRPISFVLGLVACPPNGNYIRSIKFLRPPDDPPTPFADPRFQAFHHTVQHLFGLKLDQRKALDDPITIMTIASLAPNLATLEIAAGHNWRNMDFMIEKTARRRATASRQTCTLQSLTDLSVHQARTRLPSRNRGVSITNLNGLLHSTPNLRALTLEAPSGGTSLTARLENLTTLRLTNSYICHSGLKQLVRACARLIHVEYKQSTEPWWESYLPVSPAQALECLAPCRSTLQRLHLAIRMPDLSSNSRRESLMQKPYPLLTTLEGFSALKQVAVDIRAIERPMRVGEGLARLLWPCTALEGVFLLGVEEFPAKEFACFARGVVERSQWPRLSIFKLQVIPSTDVTDAMAHDAALEKIQNDLQSCLPRGAASRMRQAGVKLLAVSSKTPTSPFAEN